MDVVLRKDAETHFVEVALIELLERLLVHFFRLVRPRVARGADGIVRRGVFIGEMVRVRNTHRAVVIAGRLRYGEIAGRLRFREAADRFIDSGGIGIPGLIRNVLHSSLPLGYTFK